MTSEAEIIIAFLFKRSGKTALKESEIYLPLSLELGWFTSQQAAAFVKNALNQNLLVKKGVLITPNFDINKVTIPVGFQPSKQSLSQEIKTNDRAAPHIKTLYEIILDRIGEKTGEKKEIIQENVKKIQTEKQILPEIAALTVAHAHQIEMSDLFDQIKNHIFKENEE